MTMSRPTLSSRQRWLILSATSLGAFSALLGFIAVPIALPTMANELNLGLSTVQWVLTSFLVISAATMLPLGSAGDILGRLKILILGFILLIVGMGYTAIAQGIGGLIFARVVQGLGAAMLMVSGPAIATSSLPESERGRAVGVVTMGGFLASGIGPILGGFVTQHLGWRWIFYMNIPPAVIGLVLATQLRGLVPPGNRRPFDIKGAVSLAVFLSSAVIGIGHGQEEGWKPAHTFEHILPLGILALLSLGAFIFVEKRAAQPMLPLSLFKNKSFTTNNICNGILHMAMLMVSILIPFYLQGVLGIPAARMGLLYAPMSVTLSLMAIPSGWLYDRYGSKKLCAGAMAAGTLVLFSYMTLDPGDGYAAILPRMIGAGVTLGLFVTPNVSAIFGSAPREHLGVASGTEQTSRQFGHALGAVLAAAISGRYLQDGQQTLGGNAFMAAFYDTTFVSALLMGIGVFFALQRRETTLFKRA